MAPTLVQTRTGVATGAGTLTVASWVTPTTGNLLVLRVSSDSTMTTPTGWTLIQSGVNWSGEYLFYRVADATETTVAFTVGGASVASALEFSGVDTSGDPVVASTSAAYGAGTAGNNATSAASSPVTTTAPDQLVVVGFGGNGTSSGFTPVPFTHSGWTNSFTELTDLFEYLVGQSVAYLVPASAGSYSTTATFTPGVTNGFALAVAFAGAPSSTVTGTAATTLPSPVAAAAGTVVNPPGFAGSAAITLPSPTLAASGTATSPSYDNPVHEENAQTGESTTSRYTITGPGDLNRQGFARSQSVNAGDSIDFAVHGAVDELTIYRIGHYNGLHWREIATVTNTATTQPSATTIADSNGATSCANWSTTATWNVPASAVSGLYVAVARNSSTDAAASHMTFVVRNDSRTADIVVKIADSTWQAAYNYYGDFGSELTGKSVYGAGGSVSGTTGITGRSLAVSYDRPNVTRAEDVNANLVNTWENYEGALIDWLEANAFDVKYIASTDLDAGLTAVGSASVLVSPGHDEYWSQGMWDNAAAFRDAGGHLLFMSANEVFWRVRFSPDRRVMWCYKDTMPGPGAHVAGDPLDPVSWTGTWRDLRRPDPPGSEPESLLSGSFFRMNGINDRAITVNAATYGSSPFWRDTSVATGTDLTVSDIIGFEADSVDPRYPSYVYLARTDVNINGAYADDNGQTYENNGTLQWGVVMFRTSNASGITVDTCSMQWIWGLSNWHRRGSARRNIQMRQATANLLVDLGAVPATLESDLTEPTPVPFSAYGLPESFVGTGATILPSPTVAATGTSAPEPRTGTAAASLPVPTVSASGTLSTPEFTGTAGVTLPAPTASAAGTHTQPAVTGTAAATLPAPVVAASGTLAVPEFTGTATIALPAPTTAASGTVANPPGNAGAAAVTLPTPEAAASGSRTIPPRTGTATVTLPTVTSTAAGAVDNPGFSGNAAITLPISSVAASGLYEPPSSGGTTTLTLPTPTITATGARTIPPRTGTAALTLPAPTVAGFSVFPAAPTKRTITISRPARTVEVG